MSIGVIPLTVDFPELDVDEWFEILTKAGVKSVSAPVTPTIGPNKGGRAVYMIDPDGYRVELIQSSRSFGEYNGE